MGFPRQEYWSGLPFAPPGNLPDPGSKPESDASVSCIVLGGVGVGLFTTTATWDVHCGEYLPQITRLKCTIFQ